MKEITKLVETSLSDFTLCGAELLPDLHQFINSLCRMGGWGYGYGSGWEKIELMQDSRIAAFYGRFFAGNPYHEGWREHFAGKNRII